MTLDPDVVRLLRQAMQAGEGGMKETLNAALRRGLAHQVPAAPARPFVLEPKAMGLRAGIDPARLHDLADELEIEALAETTRKLRRTAK
jgi:hypothetical protein